MKPSPLSRTEPHDTVSVSLTVNSTAVRRSLPARMTLADALRDELGLTGTHVGCEHGICGMCTVLVDGEAARSCLLLAVALDGSEITTVEGLGTQADLHPLQEAFGRHHALQCGFCTPGFLLSSYDLLAENSDVDRKDLPAELSGVLCRCTGYRNIVAAVADVAERHRDGSLPGPAALSARTLIGRRSGGQTPLVDASAAAEAGPGESGAERRAIALPAGPPTIEVAVVERIDASREQVAEVFSDIYMLASCLPGAELTDDLGDRWYRGRSRVALGPVRLAFAGLVQVIEQAGDRVEMLAQGTDVGGGGAQAKITMTARSAEEQATEITATADVFLTGRIAGFGRSLANDVSHSMFEKFARAVEQAARGEKPVQAQPPGAAALAFTAIRGRLRALRERVARDRSGGDQNG